eukprot:sb/3472788/
MMILSLYTVSALDGSLSVSLTARVVVAGHGTEYVWALASIPPGFRELIVPQTVVVVGPIRETSVPKSRISKPLCLFAKCIRVKANTVAFGAVALQPQLNLVRMAHFPDTNSILNKSFYVHVADESLTLIYISHRPFNYLLTMITFSTTESSTSVNCNHCGW